MLMTGPLAPFAEEYRRELRERGYTERSAVNELRQVARFSRWLQAGRLSVRGAGRRRGSRSSLAGSAPSGVTGPSGHGRGWCACSTCCASWGCWRPSEPARAGSPAEVLLAGFGRYLAAERGLAAGTVRGYVGHARRFLEGLRPAPGWPACAPGT